MKLYKYRSCAVARLILQTRTLRAANISKLNDPFDLNIESLIGSSFKNDFESRAQAFWDVLVTSEATFTHDNPLAEEAAQIQKVLKESTAEQRVQLKKMLLERLDFGGLSDDNIAHDVAVKQFREESAKDGIICFSKSPSINPCWAHYGENHAGVALCIEPSFPKDSVFTLAKDVNYTDQRPMLHSSNEEFVHNSFFRKRNDVLRDYFEKHQYTKSLSWSYEEEVRVVLPRTIDPAMGFIDINFFRDELTSMYFGNRITQEEMFDLIRLGIAVNPQMEFYKMVTNKYTFSLEAEKIFEISI